MRRSRRWSGRRGSRVASAGTRLAPVAGPAGALVRLGAATLHRRAGRLALVAVGSLGLLTCCGPALLTAGVLLLAGGGGGEIPACGTAGGPGAGADGIRSTVRVREVLDPEQRANGALIVEVGIAEQVPPRGWVIAVATAMQESGLRNLPHLGEENDHDSLGLFQQRPSQGWGKPEQIRDPRYAATAFYRRLVRVPGWQEMSLTEAAQAVQRSAYPDAYARHGPLAVAVVDDVVPGAAALAGFDAGVRCASGAEVTVAGWVRPADGPVRSGFRTAARPRHDGIDLGARRGSVVRAASGGTVVMVACDAVRRGRPYPCDVDGGVEVAGCGWYVDIVHPGDVLTRYCHLGRRPAVEPGLRVAAGQAIGVVGSSGNSSGPHLHFEVEVPDGVRRRPADPVAFLADRGVTLE